MQGFFHSGIAPADGDYLPASEEWCIAGPAVTYPSACRAELFFSRDAELAIVTAERQNHGPCGNLFLVAVNSDVTVLEFFQLCGFAAGFYLGAEIDGLFLQLLNQAGAGDSFNAGIVFYSVGAADLPAWQEFLKNQGFEPVACRVKARSQTGGSGANYYAIIMFSHNKLPLPDFDVLAGFVLPFYFFAGRRHPSQKGQEQLFYRLILVSLAAPMHVL